MTDVLDSVPTIDDAGEVLEQVVDAVPGGGRGMGLAIAALLLGTGVGSGIGYLLASKRLETKYSAIASEEIEEMREVYMQKVKAAEGIASKGSLTDLVKAKGYDTASDEIPPKAERETSSQPPMAVQPPQSVLEAEDAMAGEPPDDSAMASDDVEGPAGVRRRGEETVVNVFTEAKRAEAARIAAMPQWDWAVERARRSPDEPYVIHYDERYEMEGYSEVSLTYFEADDVLAGDHDEVIDPERRHKIIGEENLVRFGHGSNDVDVVYVRNDDLEIVYEISRSDQAYVTAVHGLSHEAYDRGPVERMRARERYASEE